MSFLLVLLWWQLILISSAVTIQKADDFQANMLVLYNNSATSMPDQTFIRTFATKFSGVPTFAYGINNYKLNDQFFYQNFDSYRNGLNSTTFLVKVISTSATNIRLFSISYIASTLTYFSSKFHSLSSAANISSGTGDRYLQIFGTKSFNSTNAIALPLLTGFYIDSSTFFMVNTTATVISNFNYQLKILTTSDCKLLRVSLYVFFCQTDELTSNGYYYKGGKQIVYSNDVNNSTFTAQISNYGEAQFLLGLRGFDGFTTLSGCYWGWQVSSVNSTVATLLIDKKQLQNIYFSLLQIGKEVADPVEPVIPPDPAEVVPAQGGSSLGIIAGLVVGIIVVAVLVVILLKYYCRKKGKYQVPKNDFFKQMPSLTM